MPTHPSHFRPPPPHTHTHILLQGLLLALPKPLPESLSEPALGEGPGSQWRKKDPQTPSWGGRGGCDSPGVGDGVLRAGASRLRFISACEGGESHAPAWRCQVSVADSEERGPPNHASSHQAGNPGRPDPLSQVPQLGGTSWTDPIQQGFPSPITSFMGGAAALPHPPTADQEVGPGVTTTN